jgi:MFS transporter, DHA1 family, 2-module integral membrane pump EmrD
MTQSDDSLKGFFAMPTSFLLIVFLFIALLQMTTDQYLPTLPHIAQFFQVKNSLVQFSFSSFLLGMSLSHFLFGPMSDKFGRRNPILIGVGISIIGSFVCAIAPSIHILIVGRLLQGLGIGCISSVGRSLIRDVYHAEQMAKIGSMVGMVSIIIMVGSPVLGGLIFEHFGWQANFWFISGVGIVIWLIAYKHLPETITYKNTQATRLSYIIKNSYQLLTNHIFISYTLCACFAAAGLAAWFTLSTFILQNQLGLSPVEYGWQIFYIALAVFFSGLINLVFVSRVGIKGMVLLGTFFMMFGAMLLYSISLSHTPSVIAVMSAITLFSLGAGLTFINAFAGAFEPVAAMAGIAGMLYAFLQDFVSVLSTKLVASAEYHSLNFLSILLFALGLSSLLSLLIIKSNASNEQKGNAV